MSKKQQLWQDVCSGTFKIISDQDSRNVYQDGSPVRIRINDTTGVINFQTRKAIGKNVEAKLPRNKQNNYSPQIYKLEGYAQCPRPVSKPYCNIIDYQSQVSTNKYSIREQQSLEIMKKPMVYDSLQKTRNRDFGYLTGTLCEKSPPHRQVLIESLSRLAGINHTESDDRPKSQLTEYDPFQSKPMTGVSKRYNPRLDISSQRTYRYVGPVSTSKEKILQLRSKIIENERGVKINGSPVRAPLILGKSVEDMKNVQQKKRVFNEKSQSLAECAFNKTHLGGYVSLKKQYVKRNGLSLNQRTQQNFFRADSQSPVRNFAETQSHFRKNTPQEGSDSHSSSNQENFTQKEEFKLNETAKKTKTQSKNLMMDFEYKKQNLIETIYKTQVQKIGRSTKGRFMDQVAQSPETNFNRDIYWIKKANPVATKLQKNFYERDTQLMEKRRFQKVLQAINMDKQYGMVGVTKIPEKFKNKIK